MSWLSDAWDGVDEWTDPQTVPQGAGYDAETLGNARRAMMLNIGANLLALSRADHTQAPQIYANIGGAGNQYQDALNQGTQAGMVRQRMDLARQEAQTQRQQREMWNRMLMGGDAGGASSGTPANSGGATVATNASPSLPSLSDAGGFVNRLAAVESNGSDTARNPRSSATGRHQFIDGTWLDFASARPDLFQGMDRQQILAARTNPQLSDTAAQWYADQNRSALQSRGVEATPAALGVAHYLGPGAAAAVLSADPSTPVADALGTALSPNQVQSYLAANPTLARQTAGGLVGQYQRRFGGNDGSYQVASAGRDIPPPPSASPNAGGQRGMLDGLNREQRTLLAMMGPEAGMRVLSQRAFDPVNEPLERIRMPDGSERLVRRSEAAGMTSAPERQSNGGPFAGNALDAQAMNILLRGDPSSPEYAAAYSHIGSERVNPDGSRTRPNMQAYRPPSYAPPGTQNGQPAPAPNYTESGYAPPERLTEGQAQAATYADRMQAANQMIESHAESGMDRANRAAAAIPGLGNSLVSSGYQQFDQASRDFINSILRRESGAVISDAEFDNARQQYLPQPGDGPEVLAQKAANRRIALEGMRRSSGSAGQSAPQQPPAARVTHRFNPQTGRVEAVQ